MASVATSNPPTTAGPIPNFAMPLPPSQFAPSYNQSGLVRHLFFRFGLLETGDTGLGPTQGTAISGPADATYLP
jgi:hypothetical protein